LANILLINSSSTLRFVQNTTVESLGYSYEKVNFAQAAVIFCIT